MNGPAAPPPFYCQEISLPRWAWDGSAPGSDFCRRLRPRARGCAAAHGRTRARIPTGSPLPPPRESFADGEGKPRSPSFARKIPRWETRAGPTPHRGGTGDLCPGQLPRYVLSTGRSWRGTGGGRKRGSFQAPAPRAGRKTRNISVRRAEKFCACYVTKNEVSMDFTPPKGGITCPPERAKTRNGRKATPLPRRGPSGGYGAVTRILPRRGAADNDQ